MNRYSRRRSSAISARDVALAAAIRGCTCRPFMSRRHAGGIAHLDMYHDHNCPAVDSGTQLLLARNPHTPHDQFAKAVVDLVRAMAQP